MFGLFRKKKEELKEPLFNYSNIAVDMHSHVLPGIDDGAQTVEDSIFLIRRMMDLGISKIIATPHIMADFYRNNHETIGNALNTLKAELKNQNIDIEIEAAAEHYYDETLLKRIEKRELLTMGDNFALFEFSFISLPPGYIQVILQMKDAGYKPVLAHPERYAYMTLEQYKNLHDWGCNLQINTISLTGYYGRDAKAKAEMLIDNELVDFISSDMHHPKHAAAFGEALRTPYVEKLLSDYPLKNVMLK